MSYRLRLSLVATLAVALATLAAAAAVFISFRSSLYGQVDRRLKDESAFIQRVGQRSNVLPAPRTPPGGAVAIMQVVGTDGKIDPDRVSQSQFGPGPQGGQGPQRGPGPRGGRGGFGGGGGPRPGMQGAGGQAAGGQGPAAGFNQGGQAATAAVQQTLQLKVTDDTRRVLAGDAISTLENQEIENVNLRVLTIRLNDGSAAQVARSVDELDSSLDRAKGTLIGIVLASIVIAAMLGWLVTRFASTPVRRLEQVVSDVAQQQDLSLRIENVSRDEIGQLATRFNEMLDALAEARAQQQQLVQDASHEMRTPLTSIKTNLEVLALARELTPQHRTLLIDVDAQIDELGGLVANLVELAHGNVPAAERQQVDLADLVAESVARARRWGGDRVRIEDDLESGIATLDRDRMGSAVDNLLSNAVKWSPDGGLVTVVLRGGELTVTDQGPGVPAEDRAFVFDRFYRAVSSRSKPGAGLGLAIVKAAAEEHGGEVGVEDAPGPDGGARFRLAVPLTAA